LRSMGLVHLHLPRMIRSNLGLILIAMILPAFRIFAIAYGLMIAPPGQFVPLLGDTWGAAAVIQQIDAGRVFPMGDPTNKTSALLVYPPGYFVAVAAISRTSGLSVPFAIQAMGLTIDLLLALAFYRFARTFLPRQASRYALLFLLLPGSLVWVRILPQLLNPDVMSSVASGIFSGSAKLAMPQAVKDQIARVLYSGHGALYDAMGMGYEWLAHSLGLMALVLFLSWIRSGGRAKLLAAGAMLGLLNLTHPYALLGWDLLCASGIAGAVLTRRLRQAKGLLAIGLIALAISSFYTVPVAYSLVAGGSARGVMSAVSGDLPWGMYDSKGSVRFPGPLDLFEVRGLSFIFAVLGLVLLWRRRTLGTFWLPIGLLGLGFVLGPLLVSLGVRNQVLARQEAILSIAAPIPAALFLTESLRWLRGRPRRGLRTVASLAALAIIVLLVVPKAIGFAAYTLRWIPKKDVVDPSTSSMLRWLKTIPSVTIYAERSRSVLIGALTHHIVPMGYVSTYTAKTWDQMVAGLRNQSLFFSNSTGWDTMSRALRYEAADLLLIDTSDPALARGKIQIIFSNSRHIVSIRSYQLYDLSGLDLRLAGRIPQTGRHIAQRSA